MLLEDFITGPGATQLDPEEILHSVLFTAWNPMKSFYRKVGTRRANALTKVSIAAFADFSGGRITRARIALGAVAPTVVRLHRFEEMLEGAMPWDRERLAEAGRSEAEEAVRPIDDQRSTAAYRRRVAAGLVGLFVEQALGG
jgi:CO/xanthine dehydrogenase FAD-binding subunit